MTMRLKSKGSWHSVHVVLLDNCVFWGKVKAQKKTTGDKVVALDMVSACPHYVLRVLTYTAHSH